MRFWLAGPRILGIRPGISFRPDELLRKPSPRQRLPGGSGSFIYVISNGRGLVKVGISTNPTARLAQLQRASAAHLSLAYVGALRCTGYAVEAEAHRTLAGYRQNGEWFNCPADMAVAAIAAAAYRLGEPIASGDPRLADEAVRISQRISAPHDIVGPVVLAIIKFVVAIPLAILIWLDFWILYQMI
jgi:hypothetical protein